VRKISIGSWAYNMGYYDDDPIPLEIVVKKLSELRYDGIELCGHRPHAHPFDYSTKAERSDLLGMIKGYGLGISAYLPDLQGFPILSDYESITKQYLKAFEINLKFCADLDVKMIRVDEGGSWFRLKAENAPSSCGGSVCLPSMAGEREYRNRWDKVVSIWKKCTRTADNYGITVLWEFEPTSIFNKPSEIAKLIDEVGSPNFKGLFETMHAHLICYLGALQKPPFEILNDGLTDFIKLLRNRIGHVHLADSDNTFHHGIYGTKKMLGEGMLNFDEIMQTFKEINYDSEWWTIDLCFQPAAWDLTKRARDLVELLLRKYYP